MAALPEGCLKDNKLPDGIIEEATPKVHMPPINNFKPKTTSADAPAPPPINTIPSSEAKKKRKNFLGRVLVILFSYFLVFFYKFPPRAL